MSFCPASFMLSVTIKPIILNILTLSVVLLNVLAPPNLVMLSVIMMNVMVPQDKNQKLSAALATAHAYYILLEVKIIRSKCFVKLSSCDKLERFFTASLFFPF
jgi:hypothetical protein